MSDLIKILIPVLVSSIITGFGVYIAYQNRVSRLREILYEKQYLVLLSLNKIFLDIEMNLQELSQFILNKNEEEAKNALTKYAKLTTEAALIINNDSKLVLPNFLITKTSQDLNTHHQIILKIYSGEYNISLPTNFAERMKMLGLWQNEIRNHIGVEELTEANRNIIGKTTTKSF